MGSEKVHFFTPDSFSARYSHFNQRPAHVRPQRRIDPARVKDPLQKS